MILKSVMFVPQFVAEKLIPQPHLAMISITEPGKSVEFSELWYHLLRIHFHDTDKPTEGLTLFNEEHAIKIIGFVENVKNEAETIIVHCAAGISRSAAVAKFISETWKLQVNGYKNTDLYNRLVYRVLWTTFHGKEASYAFTDEPISTGEKIDPKDIF